MKYNEIESYCDYHWFYENVVGSLPDGAVVAEVGVYFGHSVAYMAQLAKALGKRITIHAVDTFDGSPEHKAKLKGRDMFAEFTHNMIACGVLDCVTTIRADSSDAAKYIDEKLDFVFLDAEHSYDAVKVDIASWRQLVKPGGLLAGHDYCKTWPGVMKAVDEMLPGRKVTKNVWYYEC